LVKLVAVQLSVLGLYLPPVFVMPPSAYPAQMIISLPVQIAGCSIREESALVVVVSVQLSVLGLYLPPVLKKGSGLEGGPTPPQTIISLPVQTAV
jgi:hypothetical protein